MYRVSQRNEIVFVAYRSGHTDANYIWHISYANLYPYLNLEYKNFSQGLRDLRNAKYWSKYFQFKNQNVINREICKEKKN